MKKTLIILLALAFAVPAGAEICIYNWKEKDVVYDLIGPTEEIWDVRKGSETGYLIIDVIETGNQDMVTATYIETWTEKWKDGTSHKLMTSWENEEFHIIMAGAGNQTTVIFSSPAAGDYLTLVTGRFKNGVASKLTGNKFWQDWGLYAVPVSVGYGTCSLGLNTKWTAAAKQEGFTTVEEVANFVAGELIKKGYEWD